LFNGPSHPVEFFHADFAPYRIVCISELRWLLRLLVVVDKWAWVLHEVILDLLGHLWQLVHMLTASMVLLLLGVGNGSVQALLKCLRVRATNANPLIVLLEVLYANNLLKRGLEAVLFFERQAANVIINICFKTLHIAFVLLLKQLGKGVEEHCNLEAHEARFEADFFPCTLKHDLLIFIFVVRVVKLGNDTEDPEGLTVKLLLQVGVKNIPERVAIAHKGESQQITK